MGNYINTVQLRNQPTNQSELLADTAYADTLLAEEIKGIETNFYTIRESKSHTFTPLYMRIRVLIAISNSGIVYSGAHTYQMNEMSVMAQLNNNDITVESTESPVELLEIIMDLTSDEFEKINETNQEREIYFKHYSDCATYKEKIKSEKTLNRTILPPDVIPRMVLGSVQTTGPDRVGAHKHPMLEQLFWGLPGNDCLVHADEHEERFGESTLLHIPLGSEHGVDVAKGKSLHYLWLDFFQDQDSVSYIDESHQVDI